MGSRGQRSYSSGRRPQSKGQHPGYGGKGRFQCSAQAPQEKPDYQAVIAWQSASFSLGLIAAGTFRLVAHMTTSKKRQFRAEGIEKLEAGDYAGLSDP